MLPADKNIFLQWVRKSLVERWKLGSDRYQSHIKGFQGDPLDHGIEEVLDLLVYLFYEKRKRTELENLLGWVALELQYPSPDRQAIISRIEEYVS